MLREQWLRQVVRLKTSMMQAPLLNIGLHISMLAASSAVFAGSSAAGATSLGLTALSLCYNASELGGTRQYMSRYHDLFERPRRGKRAILRVHDTLFTLAGNEGLPYLDNGLRGLRRALTSRDTTSNSGIDMVKPLTGEIDPMCAIILQESVYALLSDYRRLDQTLPPLIEQHILTHYPEWVGLQPDMFNKSIVDARYPGLCSALTCLQSLDYAEEEQTAAIKQWLSDFKNKAPCPHTVTLPELTIL